MQAQDTGDNAKAMSQAISASANTILLAAADNRADRQAPAEGAAVYRMDQLIDLESGPAGRTALHAGAVAMAQAKPVPSKKQPDLRREWQAWMKTAC